MKGPRAEGFIVMRTPYYADGLEDLIHITEGPDDMPAHIKASLLGASLQIPITNGKLNLGIWQGIYLCEFGLSRSRKKSRN